MPPVLNAAVVRLVPRFRLDNQLVLNVLHFVRSGEVLTQWDQPALADLAAGYFNWWDDFGRTIMSSNLVLVGISAQVLSGPGALQLDTNLLTPSPGAVPTEPAPNSVAMCATISTGRAGRGFRGRMYLSGIPNDRIVVNNLIPTYVEEVNTALAQLVAPLGPLGDNDLVVYSTQLAGSPRAGGVATRATSVSLRDNVVDSQRRRLPGRGV